MTKAIKIIVGIVLMLIHNEIFSQNENGYILIGGESQLSLTSLNTSWESNLNDPKNTTTIDFSPYFGFFISNSLVLGAMIPIKTVTEKVKNSKEKTTTAAIGPFLRYYVKKDEDIRPYLQGMVGLGHMFMTKSWEREIISFGIFLYEIDAGLGFFINEKVCFELQLGYASAKYNGKISGDLYKSEIFFTKGLGIKLGLVLLL